MLEIPNEHGDMVKFITATEAPTHFGPDITVDMVNKWRKRRKVTGYRVGREVYFRVDELTEVEFVTRTERAGRPRPTA